MVFSGAEATYGNREDWQLAARDVSIHHVPGHHAGDKSILREPFVRALAEHLGKLIDSALD